MSRKGKKPIPIPEGVEVSIDNNEVFIKGPKGELKRDIRPEIKIEKCDGCGKCVEECPQKILKIVNKKVKVTDLEKCDLCKTCGDICPSKAISINGSKEDFIFYLESFGQLKPKEMVLKAVEIFDKKLNEFDKLVKKLK